MMSNLSKKKDQKSEVVVDIFLGKVVLGRKQKLDVRRVECYSHRFALSIDTSFALVYDLGLM